MQRTVLHSFPFFQQTQPGSHSTGKEKKKKTYTCPLMHLYPWSKPVSTRPWQHAVRNREKPWDSTKLSCVLCRKEKECL